jgi:glycosyltransferase involved in cell wall biosynthesis
VGLRLLIARNLEPIYDVENGLRVLELVRRRYPSTTLDVAGEGPERGRLERLAKELGLQRSVRFLGQVDNDKMPLLYSAADIALNPSIVDNMPISILEALASGVPVVSTNAGGIPAMVTSEQDAILVSPRNPVEMANAVIALWEAPERRAALREAGLLRVKAFAWSSVRELWRRVYERVTER